MTGRRLVLAAASIHRAHEMTTTSGGNVSVQDENGDAWITPARVDKGNLRRQDIVRIRPNGEHEGAHPPYSLLMPLTIQLHSQRQTAFNLERWRELLGISKLRSTPAHSGIRRTVQKNRFTIKPSPPAGRGFSGGGRRRRGAGEAPAPAGAATNDEARRAPGRRPPPWPCSRHGWDGDNPTAAG